MIRYFIYLSYDGTAYHGWQIQPNGDSVQERLQQGLSTLLRRDTTVVGAGRTEVCQAIVGLDPKDEGTVYVKGEKVEVGQTIGTVGNSASFEIEDEYHLHFELLKDNEYLNPVNYINFE